MPIPADFLPQFNAFRVDDWCNWFFAFFAGSRPKPELIITREEPVAALLDLFDSLTDRESRRALANAAISMLEHEIPAQQDAERIFALLQVVSYTKPLHSKRTLDRLLNDGTLWHIHGSRDQSTPLQYALLSVRGAFGIDNNLVSYIHLSAAQHSTFDYLILCVRVLQRRSVWLAWFYLARLLVRHLSAEQEILVAQIVRAAVLRDKAREAFELIHRHNRPNSRCLSPEASSRLMHVLATDVVPWTTTLLLPNHDPYHPLLSALSLSSPTDLSETDRRALITLTDHPTVDSTHLLYVIARLRSSFQRHSERSLLAACNEYLTERLVPWDPGFLKDVHPEVCVTAAELTRISILALARPQYTPAPLRTARPFTLNPAHHLCW